MTVTPIERFVGCLISPDDPLGHCAQRGFTRCLCQESSDYHSLMMTPSHPSSASAEAAASVADHVPVKAAPPHARAATPERSLPVKAAPPHAQ